MKKSQEKNVMTLDVSKMRILKWMSGYIKLDRIMNGRITGTGTMGEISKKVQESTG